VEEIRAAEDFDAARFRAFTKAVRNALTGRARRLVDLDAVLDAAGPEGRSFGGVREILPPIDVYRVGDGYYVIDGHHRVSVARSLGRDTINARVIDVQTRAPLGTNVNHEELLKAAEYAQFLEATQLHRLRPEARLECSRLGRYDEIFKHILGHQYFMGLERGRQVSLPEAAASWYDTVYTPIAKAIRRHKVLEQLPGWTEADVYVEVTRRWLALSEAGQEAGPHPAVHELLNDEARRWWQRRWSITLPERRKSDR
jgi:hypothetical protein